MTITCHVYDLKVSHNDASDITKFVMWLEGIYGKNLTFRMGKVHDYLVMDLDYSEKGSIKVSMIKYVDKFLMEFPEEIVISETSPSDHWMLQVREEEGFKLLPEEKYQDFHYVVSQLLLF